MNIYIKSMLLISVCLLNAFTFANDSRHLTITSPLPEDKPCVCETKLNLLTYLEKALATTQDPLTEEEKRIIAEVDGHKDLEWWNLSEEEQEKLSKDEPIFEDSAISLSLCFQLIHSQDYLDDIPSAFVTILEAANRRYAYKTGEVYSHIISDKFSAKQVYIGKVFMEKYLLKQKCDMGDFKELEPYKQVHNKPIFFADILNEKQGMQFVSKLKYMPYEGSRDFVSNDINNYLQDKETISTLTEFKELLFAIKKDSTLPQTKRDLASIYITQFGFKD